MGKIQVMIVDDHQIVCAGFKQLLQAEPNISVIAEASNSSDAFELYKQNTPDIILMDLSIPISLSDPDGISVKGGFDAADRILKYDANARIIVLSVWENSSYPTQMMTLGAKGYLTKRCALDELITAVNEVFSGNSYYSASIQSLLEGKPTENNPVDCLTSRELEIFTLLAEGQAVSNIAELMFLSKKTVHAHRSNIMRKLKLSNNTELAHLAIRSGIIPP